MVPGLISATTVQLVYMAAALCFVLGIKRLAGVRTARSGNVIASFGMLLAIAATMVLLWGETSLLLIALGLALGTLAGTLLALRVPMTAMPEMVALLNGLGGGASLCVALAEIVRHAALPGDVGLADTPGGPARADYAVAIVLSIVIGAVTLSGSLIAYAKLAEKLKRNRLLGLGGAPLNAVLGLVALGLATLVGFVVASSPGMELAVLGLTAIALLLGVGLVVAIGGADMPVVISLLNSYSGMAASTTGFVLQNNLLIVSGSLVGASGLILTRIMCRAMNRSLANVLFGGFGEAGAASGKEGYATVKSGGPEEIAPLLAAAESVIVVPGYGLAVAQAQHKLRELCQDLEKRGCEVRYAIHPVAGRMPGHMNVLLAEADVPYEQLFELERINNDFARTDVAIVIGANDVCNPAAIDDPASPIAGMPVLHVWEARTVIVVKRSLSPGYAGIKNPLFERENTLMLFADAKQALEQLAAELKEQ
jgi:NAD(P) transhydrogenase subunit beta